MFLHIPDLVNNVNWSFPDEFHTFLFVLNCIWILTYEFYIDLQKNNYGIKNCFFDLRTSDGSGSKIFDPGRVGSAIYGLG